MANGSVGEVPAATFAEYDDPFIDSDHGSDAFESSSVELEESLRHARPAQRSQSRCLAMRPGLAHRIHSQSLFVRSLAKSQYDRLLSGSMIDIFVGGEKRHWAVHRNLLCHHSEKLEKELEGDEQGNKRKSRLDLPDHDPSGFELLVKWLYQGKLDDVSDMADASLKYHYAVSCYELHLLCNRLDILHLKNIAMDQYRKGLNEAELVPDPDEIDDIYRKSPAASPFRKLMTRIAARQIMDPGSERDVDAYRQCFEKNPDFALDLVKAIRHGTGGMLFEDPTETGNPCEYHDHEDGPSCHIKGKGKVKQTRKTQVHRHDQRSTKSPPSTNSDQPSPRPLPPPKIPRQHPPRQARPQDGISSGPLRRRLTSPATSTVSPEMAIGSLHQSPDASKHREKWRKITPERKRRSPSQSQILEDTVTQAQSRRAQEEPRQSSGDTSRPSHDHNNTLNEANGEEKSVATVMQRTPSRGIWDWARAGTGRLNFVARIPHPEWRGPAVVKKPEGLNGETIPEAHDDFSIPSTTATEPEDVARQEAIEAAKVDGLGIQNVISPSFAQTKRSSDELVATASSTGTPEPKVSRDEPWTNGKTTPSAASKDSPPSTPNSPTPQQRKKGPSDQPHTNGDSKSPTPQSDKEDVAWESENTTTPKKADADAEETSSKANTPKNTSSPNHVPKYKIALAPNFLSPARHGLAASKFAA